MEDQENSAPGEPISVYEHLAQILQAMATISWQKLGLQPDMMTGKIAQNIPEAKVAIDVAAYLAGIVEAELDVEDRRRIQGMIRDLRINYVQKAKELGS
jgi:hypothetical protein